MSFGRKIARRQKRKELKRPGIGNMRVKCTEHGAKPWLGDLVCAKCNKIHLIDDATGQHPTMPDDVCPCGAIMLPIRNDAGEVMKDIPFYGRIACRDCARKKASEQAAASS